MPEIILNNSISVLIVCDGSNDQLFSFSSVVDKTDTYFTMTTFVNALREYNQELAKIGAYGLTLYDVTLANRDNDTGVNTLGPADLLPNTIVNAWFTWQSSSAPSGYNAVDLSKFDVIFMFGFSSQQKTEKSTELKMLCWDGSSREDQLWAFVEFMQHGGGLFATGDHEDRGVTLCGSIPRVRSMRRWWWDYSASNSNWDSELEGPYGAKSYGLSFENNVNVTHPQNRKGYQDLGDLCSAPAYGPYRLDTVQPGPKGFETVYDVHKKTRETGVPFDRQSDDIPQPMRVLTKHPVLSLGGGQYLSHLPDHMHEGVVIGTNDPLKNGVMLANRSFEHNGQTIEEYPKSSGMQPMPAVIAQVSSYQHLTPSTEYVHDGAVDADEMIKYGAISVYDGQIVGVGRVATQSSFHHFLDINLIGDPVAPSSLKRVGFTTPVGLLHMEHFIRYWANLVYWLAPPKAKKRVVITLFDFARRSASIRIAIRPEMAQSGSVTHEIGKLVAERLDSRMPMPMLYDLVRSTLEAEHRAAIDATLTDEHLVDEAEEMRDSFHHGFLGGAMLHALEYPLTESLLEQADAIHSKMTAAGLSGAARSLARSRHREKVEVLIDRLNSYSGELSAT